MKMPTFYLLGLSIVVIAFRSGAAEFMMQFSASGFVNYSGSGVPVPTDPITGTIIYRATDIHAPIQSFTSINMVIDGHQYSVGEIGFLRNTTSTLDGIGGLANDVGGISNFTDDFWFRWNRDSLSPWDFYYTSSKRNGGFRCAPFQPESSISFSITEVPEPTTTAILFAGVAICFGCRVRKRLIRLTSIRRPCSVLPIHQRSTTGDGF